jgi:non-specific serine/threonine protein kinase
VLHKDLKPANILIETGEGGPTVRLADFGSGRLLDGSLLVDFGITNPGSLDADLGADEARSGTLAYRAPELSGDAMPTIRSDIYALGLILYQMVAGDFGKALAPGWEANVPEPLLREDIRLSAEGDPAFRLASADELAERIEQLEARREAASETARQAQLLASQQQAEARRIQRRPWVRAAAASLALGLAASTAFGLYAWDRRNEAVAARQLADASYAFIAEDVLGSADPARASGSGETVAEAMKRASASIGQRFAAQPGIAARLHLSLARAFYGRADFETARAEFALAEALFGRAGEAGSDDAAIGRMALIHMNAVSGQPERLGEAGMLLEGERKRLGVRGNSGRLGFALAQAEGAYGYMADLALAEAAFRRAIAITDADSDAATPTQLLKLKSSLALTLMRLGKLEEAEPLARAVISQSERMRGAEHPDTLVTRQHWLTSLSMLGKHERVIADSAPLLAKMEERFGPDHRFTLALRSTRFESLAALALYDDAAREADRVWKGASKQAGPQSHQALVGQSDYGSTLCQTADRARGLAIMQDALSSVRAAFGPDYHLTHSIGYFTGECLIANRHYAEAEGALRAVDRVNVAELLGRPDIDGKIDLALAESALARGNKSEALASYRAADAALRGSRDDGVRTRLVNIRQQLGAAPETVR